MGIFHKSSIKVVAPYLYIALFLLVIFLIISSSKIQRIGDGGEYYALFYAWDTTGKPWMTATAYEAYDELYASNEVFRMTPSEWLQDTFSALKVGLTSDYNHFWFYSFLAFLCSNALSLIGVSLSAHESFLVLHYFLTVGLISLAFKYFKWNGVTAVILMTFSSPMLWYVDKVHTELFTYSMVLTSVILLYAKKHLPSALFLAAASTQNPSFALIASIPILYRVILQWKRPYTLFEVCLSSSIILLVLAHPVYYFTRYGVVTPQLLAGGASPGEHLPLFYVWIIDPDLGLLPNWPLGLITLILALMTWLLKKKDINEKIDKTWAVFFVLYLAINLYAHSSTTNLNSGATPGISRYALWYIPLAFPLIYKCSLYFSSQPKALYLLLPLILVISVASINKYKPKREEHLNPTATSFFIQSYLPWLYNPPPEVFLERYSGYGEGVYTHNIKAVIGPDCHKILLLPGSNRQIITAPNTCLYDPVKLEQYGKSLPSDNKNAQYIKLDETAYSNISLVVSPDIYQIGLNKDGNYILGDGWHALESWGVWSQKDVVTLALPCNEQQYYSSHNEFTLSLKIRSFVSQSLVVSGENTILWQGDIHGNGKYIDIVIPSNNCVNAVSHISIDISNPASPLEVGISSDNRILGVALIEFQVSK